MMNIIIKTEKIVVRGLQRRKVIEIKALATPELPVEYTTEERVYQQGISLQHYIVKSGGPYSLFREGADYSEEAFKKNIEICKQCGNRLQEINARLAKENADWHGEETFVI